MKSRVVSTLQAFADPNTPEKYVGMMEEIAVITQQSVSAIRAKAQRIIRHIIHNYAAFDISTIDKFTHRVIRTFAHDLNLPVSFEVSLEAENLLAEAVDALIAQAGNDPELTKLLIDFAMEKTDDDKNWDITRELFNTGTLLLSENDREEISQFRDRTIENFLATRDSIRALVKKAEEDCVSTAKYFLDKINQQGIEFTSFYKKYVPLHLQKLIQGKYEAKPGLQQYLEEGRRYAKSVEPAQQQLVDELAPELLKALEKLNYQCTQRAFGLAVLKNLTPLSLLNTVAKELDQLQRDQNVVSIAEFNRLIHEQIKNEPAPFIYERLGDKYRHFFIDEFQDTSELQWHNLVPLIDNATSSEINDEKGTLMIVGDPKQSIYRWRGGKAEQFIELGKGKHPFNNPDFKMFSLETNYRSFSEVINFNNSLFKFLATEFTHEDYQKLYRDKTAQKTNSKQGGYVNLSFINAAACDEEDAEKSTLYVERTLEIIEEVCSKGFSYADIAILTRTGKQGAAIATALTEAKIQIISSETLTISNATEVAFIIDMLKSIARSQDTEARARALQYLAVHCQNKMPVHDFIADGLDCRTEADLEAWLSNFGIHFSYDLLRRLSLFEMVESLVRTFITEKDSAYLQFFLDIVLERDVRGMSSLSDFLDYWQRKGNALSIPTPDGENAVKIMTIHKAKGLEFPVVILPFAEEAYHKKQNQKLWVAAEESVFGLPKVLLDKNEKVLDYGDAAVQIYQQKHEEVLLDTVNVLYVALTRAEEQLYIVSAMNLTSKGELKKNDICSFFVKYLQQLGVFDANRFVYEFGNPDRISLAQRKSEPVVFIEGVTNPLSPAAISIATRDAVMWGTKQAQAIAFGNSIHEILSLIRSAADVNFAVETAVASGLISPGQKNDVLETLQNLLGNAELKEHFAPDLKVLNEQALLTPNGTLKPDRIALRNLDAYLLDYKTGQPKNSHSDQLNSYASALTALGLNVCKKAIVYLGPEVNVIHL